MKKILITGSNSYIGTSFENWCRRYPGEFQIDTMDMKDEKWKEKNFSGYDTVFHVAGLAHADISEISEKKKGLYYKINRDLAVKTARKAKEDGVAQFVFMSSMIIYGKSAEIGVKKIITENTCPKPDNFYGDSKWQADQQIQNMQDDRFKAAVIRPPMIYGKGSKGNYPILAEIAQKTPVFPDIKNERSMLYIINFCEFLRLLIMSAEGGIYFPQNKEYVQTSKMVMEIAKVKGHKIYKTKMLSPIIRIANKIPGKTSNIVKKAFGNLVYDKKMSQHFQGRYQIYDLKKSIQCAEI